MSNVFAVRVCAITSAAQRTRANRNTIGARIRFSPCNTKFLSRVSFCPSCTRRGIRNAQRLPKAHQKRREGKCGDYLVYAFNLAERSGATDTPPWQRRGGRAIKKNSRSFEKR